MQSFKHTKIPVHQAHAAPIQDAKRLMDSLSALVKVILLAHLLIAAQNVF